ncbi:hypothetical protein [Glaciimonas sp. PCH181]|uniref:hypothetical protein n=1 Tax=Glaciimonas sp. PCH181 TaxID=2133943 RepID=UPI000D355DBA|nr:hypothetical protein [Glaciimonas sp. PCH181]PUA19588.1 hypothetical protein C7W93_07010 [Glaciimonas sp. PCH181]
MAGSGNPDDLVPCIINGVTVNLDPSLVAAAAGGIIVTPTATFSFAYNGEVIEFTFGDPQSVDAALQAALVAAGAPVV